jgi:hypothetical protein
MIKLQDRKSTRAYSRHDSPRTSMPTRRDMQSQPRRCCFGGGEPEVFKRGEGNEWGSFDP